MSTAIANGTTEHGTRSFTDYEVHALAEHPMQRRPERWMLRDWESVWQDVEKEGSVCLEVGPGEAEFARLCAWKGINLMTEGVPLIWYDSEAKKLWISRA